MTRTQHWILLAGSCLVVLFLFLQVLFAREAQYGQARLLAAQQAITNGRECAVRLNQLATRIYQLSIQTQDQGLKDLMTRQHFVAPATTAAPVQPATPPTAIR